MRYYSVIKRTVILTYAKKWMNFEDITRSEKSHLQKDKYYMIPFI